MKDFETHTFLKLLDDKIIEYHYEGKWLVVDGDFVHLSYNFLTSLPNYIKFNNDDFVHLSGNKLTSLPDNIHFNNKGYVDLSFNQLTSLPDDIQFNNRGSVYLNNNPLESLPENIDEWYNKLSYTSKKFIQGKFPDHWIFDKERFNL